MEAFKRFCPQINEDCIGKKCASFWNWKNKKRHADKLKTIKVYYGKTTYYRIEEYHVHKETTEHHWGCTHYPQLTKDRTDTKEMDEVVIKHEPSGSFTITSGEGYIYTDKQTEQETVKYGK